MNGVPISSAFQSFNVFNNFQNSNFNINIPFQNMGNFMNFVQNTVNNATNFSNSDNFNNSSNFNNSYNYSNSNSNFSSNNFNNFGSTFTFSMPQSNNFRVFNNNYQVNYDFDGNSKKIMELNSYGDLLTLFYNGDSEISKIIPPKEAYYFY